MLTWHYSGCLSLDLSSSGDMAQLWRMQQLLGPQQCSDTLAEVCRDFRQIVKVGDPQKMMVLLEFIIDTDTLVDCCRDAWLEIYDKEVHHATGADFLAI